MFLRHGDIAVNSVVANAGFEGLQAIMARGGKIIWQLRQWLACSCLGLFSQVTTCKKEIGFLLIEVFSKRNYGHQGSFLGGLFLICHDL